LFVAVDVDLGATDHGFQHTSTVFPRLLRPHNDGTLATHFLNSAVHPGLAYAQINLRMRRAERRGLLTPIRREECQASRIHTGMPGVRRGHGVQFPPTAGVLRHSRSENRSHRNPHFHPAHRNRCEGGEVWFEERWHTLPSPQLGGWVVGWLGGWSGWVVGVRLLFNHLTT
jgi:hypothetical protein